MAWIYLPSTCCPSAPDTADSNSACISPATSSGFDPALWLTLSGKPTRRPLSWRGWQTRPWVTLLSGTTLAPSTVARGLDSWISRLWASRARTSPTPASARESTETEAASSSTDCGSLAKWDAATSSWRTSQLSLTEGLTPFSGPWPKAGSMRNGAFSARPTWEPPIAASGCSSWPTPDANVSTQSNRSASPGAAARPLLAAAAAMWLTPDVPNGGRTLSAEDVAARGATERGKRQVGLSNQARMWAAPIAKDGEKRSAGERKGDDLSTQTELWHTPKTPMGGPEGRAAKATRGSGGGDLLEQAQAWATPSARDWRSGEASDETLTRNSRPLNEQAVNWQTPRSADAGGGAYQRDRGQKGKERPTLTGQACLFFLPAPKSSPPGEGFCSNIPDSPLPSPEKRRLNARFEEWLMGVPLGWVRATRPLATTSYASWETACYRSLRRLLS